MNTIIRNLSFMVACAVLACTSAVQAAGIFWLSNSNVAGAPGQLPIVGAPGSTGTMYLWGQTDVGVAGMGFNVLSSGSGLTFTGATYSADATNAAAWNLGNKPIVVTGPKVSDITAATLAAAGGFGPGTSIGNTMLLASLNYTLGALASTSNLSLQVSDFGVADNQGNPLSFRFGDQSKPLLTGDQTDAQGAAGTVQVGSGDSAPVVHLINVGERELSAGTIVQALNATDGPPVTGWKNLVQTLGPAPAIAPTLAADGTFTWNPAGSKAGKKGSGQIVYQWSAVATNGFGDSLAAPAYQVTLIPEPATMTLIGLAMIGAIGHIRRRA